MSFFFLTVLSLVTLAAVHKATVLQVLAGWLSQAPLQKKGSCDYKMTMPSGFSLPFSVLPAPSPSLLFSLYLWNLCFWQMIPKLLCNSMENYYCWTFSHFQFDFYKNPLDRVVVRIT